MSGTGVAGTFTGTVDAAVAPFNGNITVSVKYNSTGGTVDEVIDVNGTPVPVLFDSAQVGTAAAPYVLVSGSGTIRLGNFVEVHGTLTFDGGSPSFTGVTFFIGQGPYKNDDGSLNPSAIGIVIDDASGSKVGTTGNAAFSGTGTVRLVGIPGLTLGGTITVQYNESTSAVQLGVPVASATAPYLFVGASDLTFAVNGMELKGGFSFTKGSNGEITVGLTTVSLDLGTAPAGGAAPVHIAVSTGTIVLGTGTVGGAPAGIVVALDGLLVTVNAPGVVLGTGASRLLVNTTSTARTVSGYTIAAGSMRLQLGSGTGADRATITVAGQSVTGVFGFEQVTGTVSPGAPAGTPPPRTTRVFAEHVDITLGTATGGVAVTGASGLFVLAPTGMAGRISGGITVTVPGASVDVSRLSVAVNTGTRAVSESVVVDGVTTTLVLPAGPYLRVEGTGIVITLAGQRITGDLVLEKARSNGADVVRVGLRNVSAAFGDGTTDLVTLSEGVGLLVITGVSPGKAGGLAGTLSGRVRMNVPGVTLDATLTLAINTRPSTDGPVNEVLTFGDQPTTTAALVVGDVNGDGRADIVVGSADKLFLYLNDGSGDPYDAVPAIVLALPVGTVTALALGDLDGDNRPELVAGTTLATVLFRNDGAGLFTVDGTVDLGTGARAVVIGAVDATAGADVLVASGTSLTRYSNLGTSSSTGLWQGVGDGSAVAGTWTATMVFALGDVNGDGKLDLFVGSGAAGADALLLGAGDGTFAAGAAPGTSGSTSGVLVDVDGNGTLDLVRTTGTGVSVALNPGGTWTGFSAAVSVVATGTVIAVGAGRVDSGTSTDIVLIDGSGPPEWRAATGTGPLSGRFPTATAVGVLSLTLPAGPYLKVTGDPVTLTIGDLSLTGGFSVTQETKAGGVSVVTITVTNLKLDLGEGIGPVTLSGAMVVSPTGLAANVKITSALQLRRRHRPHGDFYLPINTGTVAVLVPDGLGGTTRVDGGPFVQIVADPLDITFGTGGPVLSASVSIRSATRPRWHPHHRRRGLRRRASPSPRCRPRRC